MRIKEIRKIKGWTQSDLAEHSGISRSYIAAIESNTIDKSPSLDTISAIADALGVRMGDILEEKMQVPLRGFIGAGSEINLLNSDDFNEYVDGPINGNADSIAVRVSGDSMFPAYEDGELLYYSDNLPPSEMLNRKCVVKLADGRIFVKILRPGNSGFYNLESINPLYPQMIDQAVEWVARIEWTRPR